TRRALRSVTAERFPGAGTPADSVMGRAATLLREEDGGTRVCRHDVARRLSPWRGRWRPREELERGRRPKDEAIASIDRGGQSQTERECNDGEPAPHLSRPPEI